jgi:ferredoxin
MGYLPRLSKVQWVWLVGSLAIGAALVTVGWVLEPRGDQTLPSFTTAMSIRDIAPKLDVTGKALARDLGLPLDAPKGKPLDRLGIAQGDLDRVAAHLLAHQSGPLKYYVFAALVLWGLVFLIRLGRPDGSPNAERKTWYPREPYVAALLVAVAVCGFALGKSPNPMEGALKVFKSMVGLYPSVWEKVAALAFFLALAVVGNKLVCGWACPFGALQELLYSLPFFKQIKRRKVPFLVSNAIRGTLFAAMLLLLFGVVSRRKGFVLYHSMNPFNLFSFDFDELTVVITIVVALGLALLIYRPFCQFICPFGFISWLAERVSLARVWVDAGRCNQCGACVQACPLEAAKHKVAVRLFAADCYSCARCLNVCPQEAISYRWVLGGSAPSDDTAASGSEETAIHGKA